MQNNFFLTAGRLYNKSNYEPKKRPPDNTNIRLIFETNEGYLYRYVCTNKPLSLDILEKLSDSLDGYYNTLELSNGQIDRLISQALAHLNCNYYIDGMPNTFTVTITKLSLNMLRPVTYRNTVSPNVTLRGMLYGVKQNGNISPYFLFIKIPNSGYIKLDEAKTKFETGVTFNNVMLCAGDIVRLTGGEFGCIGYNEQTDSFELETANNIYDLNDISGEITEITDRYTSVCKKYKLRSKRYTAETIMTLPPEHSLAINKFYRDKIQRINYAFGLDFSTADIFSFAGLHRFELRRVAAKDYIYAIEDEAKHRFFNNYPFKPDSPDGLMLDVSKSYKDCLTLEKKTRQEIYITDVPPTDIPDFNTLKILQLFKSVNAQELLNLSEHCYVNNILYNYIIDLCKTIATGYSESIGESITDYFKREYKRAVIRYEYARKVPLLQTPTLRNGLLMEGKFNAYSI